MTPTEALTWIQGMFAANRYALTPHAQQRMRSRHIRFDDLRLAAASATRAVLQPANDRWRVEGGRDMDGDDLTLVVEVRADVLIITLY